MVGSSVPGEAEGLSCRRSLSDMADGLNGRRSSSEMADGPGRIQLDQLYPPQLWEHTFPGVLKQTFQGASRLTIGIMMGITIGMLGNLGGADTP